MQDLINKIHNADCLEFMKQIPDKSIDMILCDLPYGTTACKWDTIIPFEPLWKLYKRIIKDNGAIVLTASQPFTSALVMSNVKYFRYEIIWEKERPTNIFLMKKQIGKVHENILVFSKGQIKYHPQMEERIGSKVPKGYDLTKLNNNGTETYNNQKFKYSDDYDCTKKYPRSVQYFTRDKNSVHPTQKPVALFEYLIKTYTNEGDLVLDNCSGSGTTAIACLGTNRKYICIEKDKQYYEASCQRLENYNKQLKLF